MKRIGYNLLLWLGLTLLIPSLLAAENRATINGTVKGPDNAALVGANLHVEGTSIGVRTDGEGRFVLPALPPGRYQLTVTYIGFSAKTLLVEVPTPDKTLAINLDRDVLSGPVITVTATQAQTRVSPVTFASLDKRQLAQRYTVEDMPELLAELPSTTFYSEGGHGLGYNYISMRGFDQRRIAVTVNGIPQNDPEDHNVYWVNFPDLIENVQSVQVQRGAGSSLYGPGAIGGSINVQTDYFSPKRQLKAYYGRGSYDTQKRLISYNTGLLGDNLVLFGRASNITTDGYRDGVWVDFWSFFAGAALYGQRHSARLHVYGGPIEDGLAYLGVPKSFNDDDQQRRTNFLGPDDIENFNQPHFELLHEVAWKPKLKLYNNWFFIRGYGFFDFDGSRGTNEYFRLTPEYGFDVDTIPADALIRATVDNKQGGWLPRIEWTHNKGQLVLGAEVRRHRSLHWGRLQRGEGLPAAVVGSGARRYYQYRGGKDILSLYAHHNWHLRPNLFLVTDLQYAFKNYQLKDEEFVGNDFTVPYHFVNPRLGLNYNLNEQINLYTSAAFTNREPRLKNLYDAAESSTPPSWGAVLPQFNQREDGSFDFDDPLVQPERLVDLEVGLGINAGRLRGGANLYYMDFRDEIIKSGGLDRFGQPITGNAERTVHQGIELNGTFQLLPQVALSGNVLLGSNQLKDYTVFDDPDNPTVLDGNAIAGFPNALANARLTYAWQGVYAALAFKYVGKQYTDNQEANFVDPYEVLNLHLRLNLARVGLKGLAIQGRINNLLDQKFLMHGEGEDFFPAATRNFFFALQYETGD